MWEILFGPIPDGMVVCHRCDNPPCVRPDHLFLGTQADNVRDAYAKGRRGYILSPEAQAEIKRIYRTGSRKQSDLATEYGVSQTTISRIVRS